MNDTTSRKYFNIWQQNVAKSSTSQHNLLAKADPNDWDIITLQEPYLDHLQLTWANPHWMVLYPSNKNLQGQPHTRSIILINKKIDSSQIQQIDIPSSDITAVKITTENHTLILINLYNNIHHNHNIETIANTWNTHENNWTRGNGQAEIVLLGDFNRHHSIWEPSKNDHLKSPDQLLNPLLELIVNMRLEMTLPHNTPTLEACNTGNWTCPNNVWRCVDTPSSFITCDIVPSLHPVNTDHLPIVSSIDLRFALSSNPICYNYRTINWDNYWEKLQQNLTKVDTELTTPIDTPADLECVTNHLFNAINDTTTEVANAIKITPHMK